MTMMMIRGFFLALCILGAFGRSFPTKDVDRDFDDDWEAWKMTFKKNYATVKEEMQRRLIWQRNLKVVAKHNMEEQRGIHTYTLGMNQFADLENKEFVAIYNGYRMTNRSKAGSTYRPPGNFVLPVSYDWRTFGFVTPVQNQGQCGSCWAFSATGSLEGQHFGKTGILVELSEQNLVDCSSNFGNDGCEGGFMENAFDYIRANGGIDTEEAYPYVGMETTCSFDKSSVGATCIGYSDIDSGYEFMLQLATYDIGPISVAIDASHFSIQLYRAGVYNEPLCSSSQLDHAVLVVGYGSASMGGDYWIVKNSWGPTWGMSGYIWMARNRKNMCGIATRAIYPLV